MRNLASLVLLLPFLMPADAVAADPKLSVELNTTENQQNRCLLTFVVENKNATAIDSLKLDLFVFNQENRVHRHMLIEMGPVRADKTVVKIFGVDGQCSDIRSVLLNDITACTPGNVGACLDSISLSSKVEGIRFYK
jgi:hypothetical protein